MAPLIKLENITKDYATKRALNGVDLEIHSGITGLLGPNGAGKSTLIKLLLGLVKLTSGRGMVFGHHLGVDGRLIRANVGYMPEDDCYIPGMKGIEVVQFSACLAGLPDIEALRRAHEILDFCNMKQERYREIDTYSTGMRQKIKFAAAIVHDPGLLILDEPTSGLDPEERESLLRRIQLLCEDHGKSVLISTHILPDVQAICDHVVIIADGRVRLQDSMSNLSKTSAPSVNVRLLGDSDPFLQRLTASDLRYAAAESGGWDITGVHDDLTSVIWQCAEQSGTRIQSLTPAKNSLEEIFLSTVRETADATS
ncbi:MAG: ABC transporter ATP-binding protein [Planctomycetota bacterium]